MKVHPQIISQNGQPLFVVLPYKEYQHMLAALEEAEDIEAIELFAQDTTERFPLALVERIASGESAIKVFREYRELSQSDVAKRVGVSKQYISQIENKERTGTVKLLKRIA